MRQREFMRRRDFLKVICGTAAPWPVCASAQQPPKMHRVAFVASTSPVSELIGANPINLNGFLHPSLFTHTRTITEWIMCDESPHCQPPQ